MIYIVLRAPNGDGTFSPVLGMTTGDTAQTINGVLCVPGCIGKSCVSSLTDAMDISQAHGGIPQGIEWSFDLIDWTGSARRSAGLLDGGTRFIGYRAALYISRRGDNATPAPVCGDPDYFAIRGCSTVDGRVHLQCVAAWSLNASTVSFGTGAQQVGLVVGGHPVSVPTVSAGEPATLWYNGTSSESYYTNNPGSPAAFYETLKAPQSKAFDEFPVGNPFRWYYVFQCSSAEECVRFFAAINSAINGGGCVISGADMQERLGNEENPAPAVPRIDEGTGTAVLVYFPDRLFWDHEAVEDVSITSLLVNDVPICAGAASLDGFTSEGLLSTPSGEALVSNYVLTFTPFSLTVGGFTSYSVIPSRIVFKAGFTSPDARFAYYGNVASIKTDGSAGAYDAFDTSTMQPISPTNFTVWADLQNTTSPTLSLPLHASPDPIEWNPTRLLVDIALRASVKNSTVMTPGWILVHPPFKDAAAEQSTHANPGTAGKYEITQRGPGFFDDALEYPSMDALNSAGNLTLNFPYGYAGSMLVNLQILSATVYGETKFAFGSNYAQVQPGASPWWAAPVTPGEVVAALSGNVSGPVYLSIPDGPLRTPISWGEYISPDKTYIGAAEKLCQEFWITLTETNATQDATANERQVVPAINMGAFTDVITEPVIEYAPVGGSYTKRAYISNVDQPFDVSRPGDFYGGWGKADDQDFGFEIWKICREAYKATGTKASETYQADGIHEEYHIGLEWMQRTRAGVNRISWLAYPPRYMTFSILDDEAPAWWSGAQVIPPRSMAEFAGYDIPSGAFTVVAKEFNPMTCEASFTVALPPVVSTGTTDRIIQTANPANDRIVQSLTATDRIIQISEA